MDELIIAGLAAYCTELTKGWGLPKKFMAIAIMVFTILFCFLGAWIYTPGEMWREVVQRAIILGAMTSGIYGLGKAARENPPADPFLESSGPRGPPEVTG
jgi:hypothetical protein